MKSLSLSSLFLGGIALMATAYLSFAPLSFAAPDSGAVLKASVEDPFGVSNTKINAATDNTDLISSLVTLINYILGFLGIFLLFIIIYAGFLIINSDGKEDALTKGRKMIMYAVIGVIVIVLSYTFVNFISGFGTQLGTGGK